MSERRVQVETELDTHLLSGEIIVRATRRAWLCWLLPYRTAELLDFDDGLRVGPWRWRAPLLWRAIRARQEQR